MYTAGVNLVAAKRRTTCPPPAATRASVARRRRLRGACASQNSRQGVRRKSTLSRRRASRRKPWTALRVRPRVRRNGGGELFHRWYQPELGTYTRTDPLTLFPRESGAYGYSRDNPLRYVDLLGLTTWHCSFTIGGGEFPIPLGITLQGIQADCTSDCRCGRRVSARVYGLVVGVAAAPIPVNLTTSEIELEDDSECPFAANLAGPASDTSAGVAVGPFGFDCSGIQLGIASGIGCEKSTGLRLGADAAIGGSWIGRQSENCCNK